ncbi:uncharacterized protein LOC121724236 [Tachysurus ichikawai]
MSKYGLILVLLLAKTLAQEDPEPIFKAVGETLDMFFCFGVDYIAVYRINEGEKLLLWNSSASVSPPDDYKNRIKAFNTHAELLGFQITHLKLSDAGVYLRECWLEGNLANQHTNYLYMCDKEMPFQELFLQSGGEVVDCDIDYSERDNTSIKWFRDVYPGYKTTLFLDTEKLQETLEEDLKDVIQVQDKGFSLYISEAGLEQNQNFYCLFYKRGQCKHFKSIHLPESNKPEMQTVYFAVGEKAVLSCMSEHLNQQQKYWQTPVGDVSATTPLSQMFISKSEENKDNSLVIPSITHNHFGEYTCLSQLVEAEYHITVCSELVSDNVHLYNGGKVVLDCTLTKNESVNILWYRQLYHMEIELLYDSEDPSINLPADIKNRTHISDSNDSLIIKELNENDSGAYWCVVLFYSIVLETGESIENDDEEDDDAIEDYTEDDNTETCIFKRVTQLKIKSKNLRRSNEDLSQNPQTEPESRPAPYAIIGGVFGILILGLVVLFVVKVKAKKRALDSRRAEHRTQKKDPTVSAPLVSL